MQPRLRAVALAVATAAGGCGGSGPSLASAGGDTDASMPEPAAGSVTGLVGEVHLHQFQGGTHAWTQFVGQTLPVADAYKDSITDVYTEVTSQEGDCTLFVAPTCTPMCMGATFCYAAGTCQELPLWSYIDGGQVEVTGSSVVPLIRMWWDAAAAGYDSQPAPGAPELFAAGDALHMVGGMGDFAFEQDVPAPSPVTLVNPAPTSDLHLMPGAFDVTWTPDVSDSIEILVGSQASSGASAVIRCVTADTGALTISADMMSALPPPPRQTTFTIQRNNSRIVPVARAATGIFVHAAQTTLLNGVD
jgi:hypothetical protein